MLINFFKLNDEVKCKKIQGSNELANKEFLEHIANNTEIENIIYYPDTLTPVYTQHKIENKKFKNISLKDTKVTGFNFENCSFEDCILMNTEFIECQFHSCKFISCNPYYMKFNNTYINPQVFTKMLNPQSHSNIGVILFQNLLANSASMHQPEFTTTAEFHFWKWKRYQIEYEINQIEKDDIKKNTIEEDELKIIKRNLRIQWYKNFLYQWILGYGVQLRYFITFSIIVFIIFTGVNYLFWNYFSFNGNYKHIETGDLITPAYFTTVTIATLGYGDITPTSSIGMIAVSIEAILGFIWLGLLLSNIVKKIIR
jgi:Ion channel/Pentapeptide repeats (9 copies)